MRKDRVHKMEHVNTWKAAVTAALGALTALWGWFGWLIVAWVGMMMLDYLSGTAAALKKGEWSSSAARNGIWHKMGMITVVVATAGVDALLQLILSNLSVVSLPVNYAGLICPLVLVWYCLTELGSICENAIAMGAHYPKWLPKLLAAGKDAVDKAGDVAVHDTKNDK